MKSIPLNRKTLVIGLLALAALIVLTVSALASNGRPGSGPRPVFSIQPVEEIWPAVRSLTLDEKYTEYRPSNKPNTNDTYCVYSYFGDTQVYQYIGQATYENGRPSLSCE